MTTININTGAAGGVSVQNFTSMLKYILVSLGISKILKKCGDDEYKGWIPLVRYYALFKNFWREKVFWRKIFYEVGFWLSFFGLAVGCYTIATGEYHAGTWEMAGTAMGIAGSIESIPPEISSIFESAKAAPSLDPTQLLFLLVFLGVACLFGILNIVVTFRLMYRISLAFGYRTGYALGLYFLDFIFFPMLGFNEVMPVI